MSKKSNVINLSKSVKLVQVIETELNGGVYEYQEIIFSEDGSGRVHKVSFPKVEISSEDLRTAADLIDNFRLENA